MPRTLARAGPEPRPVRRPRLAEDDATLVLRQFRLVFNAVRSHFQQVEKAVGLGGTQLWALSLVREQPGIGIGALARAMDIHQSTASNLVKTLVERGLIAAAREAEDRRTVQLRVLPAGTRLLRRAPVPLDGVLPSVLHDLDGATLARLKIDLACLIALLHVDPRAAHLPLGR